MRWEYRVLPDGEAEEQLAELGRDGWELILVRPTEWGAAKWIFKRPAEEQVAFENLQER